MAKSKLGSSCTTRTDACRQHIKYSYFLHWVGKNVPKMNKITQKSTDIMQKKRMKIKKKNTIIKITTNPNWAHLAHEEQMHADTKPIKDSCFLYWDVEKSPK